MLPKKPAIQAPRLPDDADGFDGVPPVAFEERGEYEDFCVADGNYVGQAATRLCLARCRFEHANFGRTHLPHLDLSDARLNECDVANADWREMLLSRVEFFGCRLLGCSGAESDVKDTVFRDCNLMLAQFRFTKFKAVRFENCLMRGADFQDADLRGVIFRKCDLREANFTFARLQKADLRGSDIEGLQLGQPELGSLMGLVVEPLQAALIAALLGLQVRWTGEE